MKTADNTTKAVPVIRVNNRDLNLAFYKEVLGLKVISEENALAMLGSQSAKNAHGYSTDFGRITKYANTCCQWREKIT